MHGKTTSAFWNWARFSVRCTALAAGRPRAVVPAAGRSLAPALALSKPRAVSLAPVWLRGPRGGDTVPGTVSRSPSAAP